MGDLCSSSRGEPCIYGLDHYGSTVVAGVPPSDRWRLNFLVSKAQHVSLYHVLISLIFLPFPLSSIPSFAFLNGLSLSILSQLLPRHPVTVLTTPFWNSGSQVPRTSVLEIEGEREVS